MPSPRHSPGIRALPIRALRSTIAPAARSGAVYTSASGMFSAGSWNALWLAWKWIERRRFLRQLDVARITPAELQALLDAGEEPFIVDLRSGLADSAPLIPGAVRISPEELAARGGEIPRDREIILFCT